MSGSVDPAADRDMLSLQQLKDRMKSLRLQELTAHGKPLPALSGLQIAPEDYESLLRRTYKETFKINPERALHETLEAAALTNSPGLSAASASRSRPLKQIVKRAPHLMRFNYVAAEAEAAPP